MKLRIRNNTFSLLVGCLTFASIPMFMVGCSNNDEDGLYAADATQIQLQVYPGDDKTWTSDRYEIGAEQSDPLFTVTCTTRWIVDVTDCEGAWCQISYGENKSDETSHIGAGTFRIEVAPNRGDSKRDCNVTVYAVDREGEHIAGKSKTIRVIQDGQSINVEYAGEEIPYDGIQAGVLPKVTVRANQAWEVSASQSWIEIVPGEGMNGDGFTPAEGSNAETALTFSFKVSPNPGTTERSAELVFSSPTSAFIPIRRTITQKAASGTFFIVPSEYTDVSSSGADLSFSIYSPLYRWEARTSQNWIEIENPKMSSAAEPVDLKVRITENDAIGSREGGIIVESYNDQNNLMGRFTLTIKQNGKPDRFDVISPSESPLISYDGGSINFVVVSPSNGWYAKVESSGDWLTLSPYSGNASEDNVTVRLTAQPNPYHLSRTCNVVFYRDNNKDDFRSITVTQAGNPNSPEQAPSIGTPWLVNGWSYKSAELVAYVSSPYASIYRCYAVVTALDGSEDPKEFEGNLYDGKISVTIRDLKPNTEYSAELYVIYELNGSQNTQHSQVITFTTPDSNGQPGTTPGIGDNNPPSTH